MKCRYVMLALAALLQSGSFAGEQLVPKVPEGAARDGAAVIFKLAGEADLTQPLPLLLDSLEGMKLAFQAKGSADVCFTLHDEAGNKDLKPQRSVWKFTGNSPHVPGYQWGGGNWTPCLYRMDLFGQDGIYWRKMKKTVEGRFTRLNFARPGNVKDNLHVRNLVLYRGEDNTPPEAPSGLAAQSGEDGISLSWRAAQDNVGVAWYVLARAPPPSPSRGGEGAGGGRFAKIAQLADLEYTDKPPAAGAYRYRVLAADYERNLSPWSEEISVQVRQGFRQPEATSLVKDSAWYAEHIRKVHAAGAGKVAKGTILFYGDCLHYLDRTRNFAVSIEGLLTHSCVNDGLGISPCNPSSKLAALLPKELELKPEFCVISAGLEDLHPKPWPEAERLAPEDRQKAVDNVLAMVRLCEQQGTVALVTTLTPFGHNAPKGSPEELLSDELAKECEESRVPVVRVFDLFRKAQEAGEDYKQLMACMGTTRVQGNPQWPRGYEYDPYTPSFELGITKRFIVVKETLDRVLFTLLDLTDEGRE